MSVDPERLGSSIHTNLDLLSQLKAAVADGNDELAKTVRTDLEDMIDVGNAGTYFELTAVEYGLSPDHPDYDLVRQIAEKTCIHGMTHARSERQLMQGGQ